MDVLVLNPPFLDNYSRSQRSPAVTKSGTVYFPLWLSFVTGMLERDGHDVRFIDAPAADLGAEAVLAEAAMLAPRLVVVDTSTPSIESDLALCVRIREALPETFILLAGTHVSALADETLKSCVAVNAVARREADHTVRDLAAVLAGSAGTPSGAALAGIEGL